MDRPEHLMIAMPSRDAVRSSVLSHLVLCMLHSAFYWKRRISGDAPITYFFQARSHIVEADATGFACLLMHRSVWEAVCDRTQGRPFAYRMGMGEDVYFCAQACAAGVQLFIVPNLVVGHATDVVIVREHRLHALATLR